MVLVKQAVIGQKIKYGYCKIIVMNMGKEIGVIGETVVSFVERMMIKNLTNGVESTIIEIHQTSAL
jgi:hypothetical protein